MNTKREKAREGKRRVVKGGSGCDLGDREGIPEVLFFGRNNGDKEAKRKFTVRRVLVELRAARRVLLESPRPSSSLRDTNKE